MPYFRSCAEWDKSIPGFHQNKITTDTHETKEQAEAVCNLLKRYGFGGCGAYYPIKTWVEEVE